MQKTLKGKVSFIFFLILLVVVNLTSVNINLRTPESDNLLSTNSLSSDYEFKWIKTWGSGYDDIGYEVATDSFNNIYLVGYTDTTGSDNCDIKILKYDSSGVEVWSRTWGGINDDKAYDICIDSADNIFITGYTKSLGDPDGDIVILKYDTMGNEIWNKTWGGSLFDYGAFIMQDSSDNFFIVGQTQSFGDTTGDALIVKFNNNFEEQWSETWGGNEPDVANKIEKGSDGYLYVVGHSDSVDPDPGYSDVMLLKYDDDGNYQWERTWGTSFAQRGVSLALDSNDNIYLTGYSFGHPASSGKGYLLKYSSSGTYQWERIWGVNGQYGNYFYNIIIDDKDELYISGCTKTYGIPDNYDTLLLNYDTSGNQNWYKYWAGTGFEVSPGICMDSFGNIYLAGYSDTDSAGGYDTILLKYKNTLSPEITIITPDINGLYRTQPPDFTINIDDPDYDLTWYSLDGGATNVYSNETTGTIDQIEWDKHDDGTVTITFYANSSLGNIVQAEVTVQKDVLAPLITINSPGENQIFGEDGPSFDLTIIEHEINSSWYTLDYGIVNVSFSGSTGIIDQTEWNKLGGGFVPIRFYANDSFGDENFSEVIVVKDIVSPIVSINLPINDEIFGSTSPNFNITVTESNLDSMWYTLDSGVTNIMFVSFIGTIDQTEWNKQGDGILSIIFYAKDIGENEGFAELTIQKETGQSEIIILTPENKIYTEPMNGYYPATYGFENCENDELPYDWYFVPHHGYGEAYVVETLDGHNKVLKIEDTSSSAYPEAFQEFNPQTIGSIELYLRKGIGASGFYLSFYGNSSIAFAIKMDQSNNGKFEVGLITDFTEFAIGKYSDYTWFHFRIDFNTYSDEASIFLDGIRVADIGFSNNVEYISKIRLGANYADTGTFYADAIGYSWDSNYNIGDNQQEGLLLSLVNNMTLDWVGYSLDGSPNITIAGNKVIPFPENGMHSIILSGTTPTGTTIKSNLRYFTINAPEPPMPPIIPENPFLSPMLLISIGIGIVALISIPLIVFRRKMFGRTGPTIVSPQKHQADEIIAVSSDQMKFCPFCGSYLNKLSKFCIYCGASLTNT